jgi:ubiquinone/menaquinone biosynthesis C-methylase UbiE
MEIEAKNQLKLQQERWNSRADKWDEDIKCPEHYANFEDGYQKFLDFEKRELSGLEKQESGIDIGCGTGVTSVILADKVKNIYLLDIAEKMLMEAKKKLPNAIILNTSATDIPLADSSINVALSRGIVVSHLPESLQENFFDELKRVVRPDGKIIIDFLSNIDTVDFPNASPKVMFTKQEVKEALEERGFSNIVFDGEDNNRVIRVSAIKR